MELYSVAPRATECPLRVHIHYWVTWQGRSCVKCNARAHGMISLCTLQTSRSLCTDPDHIHVTGLAPWWEATQLAGWWSVRNLPGPPKLFGIFGGFKRCAAGF